MNISIGFVALECIKPLVFQSIVEGMLVQLMLIFVRRLEQCANSFATQIYGYDRDYPHYPLLPVQIEIENQCSSNQQRAHSGTQRENYEFHLFWLLNFNRMQCHLIADYAQIDATDHLCGCGSCPFCFSFGAASKRLFHFQNQWAEYEIWPHR